MRNQNSLLLACAVILCGSLTYLGLSNATTLNPSASRNSPISASPTPATAKVPPAAQQEILAAAKLHRVQINKDRITYVDQPSMKIVRAWITGIEKYTEADFQKGAPVMLMVVTAKNKLAVPNGSYVVELRYDREGQRASQIFKNRAGAIVADQKLDRPVLRLPDEEPSSGGEGKFIPICETYDGMFRSPCNECACRVYRQSFPPGEDSLPREWQAFRDGLNTGYKCVTNGWTECLSASP